MEKTFELSFEGGATGYFPKYTAKIDAAIRKAKGEA
jgi:hypothetical protein